MFTTPVTPDGLDWIGDAIEDVGAFAMSEAEAAAHAAESAAAEATTRRLAEYNTYDRRGRGRGRGGWGRGR